MGESEINAWARSFLGETCMVPRGTVFMLNSIRTAIMHPADAVMLITATKNGYELEEDRG